MTPFVADLRHDLVRGIERDTRRRRRTARVAAGVSAAALAAALPLGLATRGPERALAITRTPTTIELRIQDASAGADQLTRELRAAGVDGEVRVVPTGPELVGRWAAVAELAGGTAPETVRLDRIRIGSDTIAVPVEPVRESTGRLVFLAGREPRAGESPQIEDGRVPPELVR